jgi:4-alpha-glucanotransferase
MVNKNAKEKPAFLLHFSRFFVTLRQIRVMKLKFSIHYNTAWGESLHVALAFHSQDGTVRRQNVLMQTEDGDLWTLETAALISRHHPLSHIVYAYQVENAASNLA